MKIISIGHKGAGTEFVFVIVNDDVARRNEAKLKAADAGEHFDIKLFGADTFDDALNYVKSEQDENDVQR